VSADSGTVDLGDRERVNGEWVGSDIEGGGQDHRCLRQRQRGGRHDGGSTTCTTTQLPGPEPSLLVRITPKDAFPYEGNDVWNALISAHLLSTDHQSSHGASGRRPSPPKAASRPCPGRISITKLQFSHRVRMSPFEPGAPPLGRRCISRPELPSMKARTQSSPWKDVFNRRGVRQWCPVRSQIPSHGHDVRSSRRSQIQARLTRCRLRAGASHLRVTATFSLVERHATRSEVRLPVDHGADEFLGRRSDPGRLGSGQQCGDDDGGTTRLRGPPGSPPCD